MAATRPGEKAQLEAVADETILTEANEGNEDMFNVKRIGAQQWVNSGGQTNTQVVCVGPCKFFTIVVFNTDVAGVYVQLFDAVSQPNNGATPVLVFKVPTDSQGAMDYYDGRIFKLGLWVMISTTAAALTLSVGNGSMVDVAFRKGATS